MQEARVAVVTGASRGAGRGIALALGGQGFKVYVTGRSTDETLVTDVPGTIDETAAAVTECGGSGVPIRCDHTVDEQVEALFKRIDHEHGSIDVLVNNVWGGYEGHDVRTFDARFWCQPTARWEAMFEAGLRAHFVASQLAASMMIRQERGLIVNTTAWDRERYLGNLFYDVAKAAVNRMAYGMALELRPYRVAAVALAPGFMRTERVMQAHAASPFDLSRTESPAYVGRAVVALASDPHVLEKSGRTLRVGDLAAEYGFTDVDGSRIPAFEIPELSYEKDAL